jgi:hypothetical protein
MRRKPRHKSAKDGGKVGYGSGGYGDGDSLSLTSLLSINPSLALPLPNLHQIPPSLSESSDALI